MIVPFQRLTRTGLPTAGFFMPGESMSFEKAFEEVIGVEGGYSNNPNDSGGETNWGITESVARENGYKGHMKDLPIEKAQEIYKSEYWDVQNLDAIYSLSPAVALELFDTGVNQGIISAGGYLQESLNVLNARERFYPDIIEDGIIGNKTIQSLYLLRQVRGVRGMRVLVKMLNCLQGAEYIELAQRREKDEDFVFGWMDKRVTL